MKTVVFHGIRDIRLDDVPDPTIQAPTDAIVRIIASAICGTDLHMVRGTFSGMEPGTVLGHEAVGVVDHNSWRGPRRPSPEAGGPSAPGPLGCGPRGQPSTRCATPG